jgi:hypothetical protein
VTAEASGSVPRVVRSRRSLTHFEAIKKLCTEWFTASEIALTVVSGSVADERVLSAMNFIKSDARNRLDIHLEACLQVYTQDLFSFETLPYEKLGAGSETAEEVV